jgi:hypothetical protein
MKRLFLAALVMALALGEALETTADAGRSDLAVMVTGVDAGGEPMALSCELALAAVPSNLFVGECQITVGQDHVSLGGMDVDGVALLTVVLNGDLTVHGVAQSGSGRFRQPVTEGIAGFPMWIEIDPLSRAWVIRGDAPGGLRQTISRGRLDQGAINLALPPSSVPPRPEDDTPEESTAGSPMYRGGKGR